MMSVAFKRAVGFVFRAEGGYCNNPDDHGGATCFGVTQVTYTTWLTAQGLAEKPVKTISREEAEKIYFDLYWVKSHCEDLPPDLALIQFDTAVQCGVGKANRLLQQALGVEVDGKIGPVTLAVARSSSKTAVKKYLTARNDFYHEIVTHNPKQSVFLKGWLNRLAHLETEVSTMA